MWFWASVAVGATLNVGVGHPYQTLQAAVDEADWGDDLLLHDDLIEGDVHVRVGLQLTLRSPGASLWRGNATVDGQLVISDLVWEVPKDDLIGHVGVYETGTLELRRVTTTRMGFSAQRGRLTVSDSVLLDSWVFADEGAIVAITDSTMIGEIAQVTVFGDSTLTFERSSSQGATDPFRVMDSTLSLLDAVIRDSTGDAVYCGDSACVIRDSLVQHNVAATYGPVAAVGGSLELTRTRICDNEPGISAVHVLGAQAWLSNNLLLNNEGYIAGGVHVIGGAPSRCGTTT
jgi:hypothetical protein